MNPVERWLASRSGTELRLQVLGALLLFEYTGYALINHLTVWRADTLGHNYLEPWSALDNAIPFVPAAILLYLPLLPMVAVPADQSQSAPPTSSTGRTPARVNRMTRKLTATLAKS